MLFAGVLLGSLTACAGWMPQRGAKSTDEHIAAQLRAKEEEVARKKAARAAKKLEEAEEGEEEDGEEDEDPEEEEPEWDAEVCENVPATSLAP